jgi:glycosyltransferase involved in cell wall biosynthesis
MRFTQANKLLVAMPVFNEKQHVNGVLEQVLQIHPHVLMVDDGSTDGTGELLAARKDVRVLRHPNNRGYGQSLIDAFAYADAHGYEWVITIDCDGQHEPKQILEFMAEIETDRWDLISGSRYMVSSTQDDLPPPDRRAINATITAMLNETLQLNLTDAFCGFKAHRVSAMRKLTLTEKGYAFPLQLWPAVWAAGFRITEIPVRLIYNDPKRSFGGVLDDAERRLQHYLTVFRAEMKRLNQVSEPPVLSPCCCG